MEKEFVNYEIALELKKLDFEESCFACISVNTISCYIPSKGGLYTNSFFDNDFTVSCPLFQQVFQFFREKHNLLGTVYSNASGYCWEIHDNIGGTHRDNSEYEGDCEESGMFSTFNKAEIACIQKLIEIAQKN